MHITNQVNNRRMMQNINLMMNQYPYYITATNHITPIFTIDINIIYNYVVNMANTITSLINSTIIIITFVLNDLMKISTKYLTNIYNSTFGTNHDLAFILLVAGTFIFINFYDKFIAYLIYQKPLFDKITKLEQEIQKLKKTDRMRETDTDALMKNNVMQAEEQHYQFKLINEQLKNIQKQMKKMDKEVKMYN